MNSWLGVVAFATDFVKGVHDSTSIAKDVFLIFCLGAVGVALQRGEQAGISKMVMLILFGLLIGATGGVPALIALVKGFLNVISGIGG